MLVRLTAVEMMPILKGIVVLMLFIVIGVAAAEYQLNSLTLQSTHVRSFNIKREQGIYSVHILGKSASVSAVYPIASLQHSGRQIILKNNSCNFTIPTMILIDVQQAEYWLNRWRRQFVDEAYKTKENFLTYFREIVGWLKIFNNWTNEQIKHIRYILACIR